MLMQRVLILPIGCIMLLSTPPMITLSVRLAPLLMTWFNPVSLESYGEDYKKHQLKRLEKQAKQFGLQLIPMLT